MKENFQDTVLTFMLCDECACLDEDECYCRYCLEELESRMTSRELLNIHLAEMKFVNDQMHARMANVSRLINLSAVFFTGLFITFAVKEDVILTSTGIQYLILSLAPFPFLFIALLISREHLLMISHDEYFLQKLRPMILRTQKLDGPPEIDLSEALGFLQSTSRLKIAPWPGIFSAFQYVFPGIGIL